MTPAARIAGAIELLAGVEAAPRKPADAIANDFFRARRYIGSGDRRAVSARAWAVLRAHRRLAWWLERAAARVTPRMLVAASLLTEGWAFDGVDQTYSGGQFAPTRLDQAEKAALRGIAGHTIDHPEMPLAVRLEVPDWAIGRLASRFGDELPAEMAALGTEAPLDLRVNLLKTTREAAQAALAAEGIVAAPTPLSPWGLRVQGRRPVSTGPAFQQGLVEIQDEGEPAGGRPGGRAAGDAGRRLVRRGGGQDPGPGDDHGESRPYRRLRRVGASSRRRGAAAAARRRS